MTRRRLGRARAEQFSTGPPERRRAAARDRRGDQLHAQSSRLARQFRRLRAGQAATVRAPARPTSWPFSMPHDAEVGGWRSTGGRTACCAALAARARLPPLRGAGRAQSAECRLRRGRRRSGRRRASATIRRRAGGLSRARTSHATRGRGGRPALLQRFESRRRPRPRWPRWRRCDGPVWLLAGGHAKGADFDALGRGDRRRARGAALFGAARASCSALHSRARASSTCSRRSTWPTRSSGVGGARRRATRSCFRRPARVSISFATSRRAARRFARSARELAAARRSRASESVALRSLAMRSRFVTIDCVASGSSRVASNGLEVDGCEVSLAEAEAALGVVPRGFFAAAALNGQVLSRGGPPTASPLLRCDNRFGAPVSRPS